MSYRRISQLHAARRAAIRPAGSSRSRPRSGHAVRTVHVPVPAARRRQDSGPAAEQRGGLDWARRIELAAVFITSLVAVAGLWYSNVQDQRQRATVEEGQITDRYTRAVENIGSKNLDVRLGGIYALQRIMQDSPRDHSTIVSVLTAYIRGHAPLPGGKARQWPDDVPGQAGFPSPKAQPDPDIQAALSVLARRDTSRDDLSSRLDLRRTDLAGADLTRAGLAGANLRGADLSGATLHAANLAGADLSGASLYYTDSSDADLTGAELLGADGVKGNWNGATLSGADFSFTTLTAAEFTKADLSGADLTLADASWAIFENADLSGAQLDRTCLASGDLAARRFPRSRLPTHGSPGSPLCRRMSPRTRRCASVRMWSSPRSRRAGRTR